MLTHGTHRTIARLLRHVAKRRCFAECRARPAGASLITHSELRAAALVFPGGTRRIVALFAGSVAMRCRQTGSDIGPAILSGTADLQCCTATTVLIRLAHGVFARHGFRVAKCLRDALFDRLPASAGCIADLKRTSARATVLIDFTRRRFASLVHCIAELCRAAILLRVPACLGLIALLELASVTLIFSAFTRGSRTGSSRRVAVCRRRARRADFVERGLIGIADFELSAVTAQFGG